VANTNKKFLESSARSDAENLRQLDDKQATRKGLMELRGKLKFDWGATQSIRTQITFD